MLGQDEVAARLGRALPALLGAPGEIVALRRLTGGATRATWFVEARTGGGAERLVLQLAAPRRRAAGDALSALPRVSGGDDAALMQAAGAAGVPVPRVRAVIGPEWGLGAGCLLDFVPGETIARRILREPAFAALRARFAESCGTILGRLHAVDPGAAPFLEPCAAERQVALWRAAYESLGVAVPALEVGLRWAAERAPPCPRPTIVHGDFRLGNLICGDGGIAAVLDWELACRGDPLQDLGWLCVRTWRFGGKEPVGGIGGYEALFAAYEAASGIAVDPRAVRFWEAWGSVKWAIMCLMRGEAHRRDPAERSVEAFAIGRRMAEPLHDFLGFLDGKA